MKKRKLLISIFAIVLAVGAIVGVMCMSTAAASAVKEDSWISAPEKTLVKCNGGDCDHKNCDYVYSFAVVGDTQFLNIIDTADKKHEYMKDLYQWIVDREETYNIQYVLGLGDITQSYYREYNDVAYGLGKTAFELEWANAKAALAVLDGKVPYSLVRGNHDVSEYFNSTFGSGNEYYSDLAKLTTVFDENGQPMAGFFKSEKIEDTYRKIVIGDHKYIIFTLDWFQLSKETDCIEGTCAADCKEHDCLGWVDKVLTDNSDYKAIITTHDFLYRDGSLSDDIDETYPHENLDGTRPNWEEVSSSGGNASPKYLWEVLRKHENVEMILCGHVDEDDIEVTQLRGDKGNTVTCMLIDAQTIDQTVEPVGMVAMFYVAADGKVMNVEYISTVRDLAKDENNNELPAYLGAQNQFNITLDYSSNGDDGWTETAYGDIITEVYEAHTFHILMDDDSDVSTNALYVSGHDTWESVLEGVHTYSASGIHGNDTKRKVKTYYIVMAEDYTDTHEGLHHVRATYNFSKTVIDLNDKTLTLASTASGTNVLLPFYTVSASRTPNYTITNGNINITGSVSLAITKTNAYGNGGVATLELKDLAITYNTPEGVSAKPLVIYDAGSKDCSAQLNLNLNNCDIDFSKVSTALTLFNLKDTNNNTNVNFNVKGGSVKGSTVAKAKFVEQNWLDDKVTFIKDDNGNYTTFSFSDSAKIAGAFYSETEGSTLEFGSPVANDGVYTSTLVDSNAVITKYGVIPADKANDTFVIFKNEEALYSTSNWNTLINTAIKGNAKYQSGCTVLVRKDYNTTDAAYSPSWFAYIDDITIDLDGHTLTRGKYHLFQPYGTESTAHKTNIRVINGWIKSSAEADTAIIAYNDANTNSAQDTINFVFENVKIDVSAYTKNNQGILVAFDGKIGYQGVKSSVTFNNCEFYAQRSNATVLFDLAEPSENKTDIDLTLNGCKIIADTLEGLTIAEFSPERQAGAGSPDTVFLGENGLTIQLPKSYTIPENTYYGFTQGIYGLTETSTDENYAYYTFTELEPYFNIEGYGDVPTAYANAATYPFLVFYNGSFVEGYAKFGLALAKAKTLVDTEAERNVCDTVYFVMRADVYSVKESLTVADLLGNIVVDLQNHTLCNDSTSTSSLINTFVDYSKIDMSNVDLYLSNPASVTFKNGTVRNEGSYHMFGFDMSSTTTYLSDELKAAGYKGKEVVYSFDNVTFEAVKKEIIRNWNKKGGGINVTVNVNDCTFDYTDTTLSGLSMFNCTGTDIVYNINVTGNINIVASKLNSYSLFTITKTDTLTYANDVNITLTQTDSTIPTFSAVIGGVTHEFAHVKTEDSKYYYRLATDVVIDGFGTIPAYYSDANMYPLAVLYNGSVIGYTDFNLAQTAMMNDPNGTYVYFVRRDMQNNGKKNMANFNGTIIVDLNNCEVDVTKNGNYLFDFSVTKDSAPNVNITVKNGTLRKSGGHGLFCINYNDNFKVNNAGFTLSFDNVTFVADGGTNKNVIFATWEAGYSLDGVTAQVNVNSTFNNCTFDMTGNLAGAVMIPMNYIGQSMDRVVHNVTINGGKIIANEVTDINTNFATWNDNTNGRADSIKFDKNRDGKYTTLVMPSSVSSSGITGTWNTVNGFNCVFVKVSESDGYVTYELGIETENGNIPAEYLDATVYPIVVFKADKTFVGAYETFADAAKAAGLAAGVGSLVGSMDCTILFRADYTDKATANVTDYYNNVTIDLGGNKVSLASVSFLTLANTSTNTNKTYGKITITNGFFDFVSGGNTVSIVRLADKQKGFYTIDFNNVHIYMPNLADHKNLIYVGISTAGSTTGTVKTTFTNCVFDYTSNPAKCYVFASGNTGVIDATVIGGKILDGTNNKFLFVDTTNAAHALAYYPGTTNDKLTIVKNTNGEYVKLLLNNETEAPTATYTVNGIECVYVKSSADDTTTTYMLYPKVMMGYKIKTSVTLWSNFVYNIYIPKANFNSVKLNGLAVDYEEVENDGVMYYHVAVNLAAAESLSDIKLAVALNSGETTVTANWTLNVLSYTKSVINGNYDKVVKTLMKDMLAYASAAHTYFDNALDTTKANEVTALLAGYTAVLPTGEAKTPASNKYFKSATVNVGEVPSFRFYLADGYTADDFTFKAGKRSVEVTTGNDATGAYLEVAMYAYRMLDDVTYTVTDKDTNISVTESYNLYAYYAYANTLNNANLTAVVEGLMKYAVSAGNYRASVIGA